MSGKTEWIYSDSYFEKQDKPAVFLVLGKEVIVDDEQLARNCPIWRVRNRGSF